MIGNLSGNPKIVKQNELIFILNKYEKTAGVICSNKANGNVFIPQTILHESQEYIITSIEKKSFMDLMTIKTVIFPSDSELQIIKENAFDNSSISNIFIPRHVKKICKNAFIRCKNIQSVEFAQDSELQTIEENAFALTTIKSLSIPSSVSNLAIGWCSGTPKLENITIIRNEQENIKLYDGNIIIGKIDIKSDTFDALIFVPRKIKKIVIPSFIKQISTSAFHMSKIKSILIPSSITKIDEYAFQICRNLYSVDFSPNSQLEVIGKYSFVSTAIEKISIPSHVKKICEGAFSSCFKLQSIEILSDSELQIIENSVFSYTPIKNISIPSSVSELSGEWCFEASELTNITIMQNGQQNIKSYEDKFIIGKSDSKSDKFDTFVFAPKNIKTVKIPPFIKQICGCAFYNCSELQDLEIPFDSQLQIIGPYSFNSSSIERIFIPHQVKQIKESAFSSCYQLKIIKISPDSKLQVIEKNAFEYSSIESIEIPSSIKNLKEGWCEGTQKLTNVMIIQNKEQNISYYDNKFIIGKSDIKSDIFDIFVFAPRNTKTVKIPQFIKKIGSNAFSNSLIENIYIPSQVKEICLGAFNQCQNLQHIEIPDDSELQIIDANSFALTQITSFFIPKNIKKIHNQAFFLCTNIKIIEIDEIIDNQLINEKTFGFSSNYIILVPANSNFFFLSFIN